MEWITIKLDKGQAGIKDISDGCLFCGKYIEVNEESILIELTDDCAWLHIPCFRELINPLLDKIMNLDRVS